MKGCYGLLSTEMILEPKPTDTCINFPYYERYQYAAFKTTDVEKVWLSNNNKTNE